MVASDPEHRPGLPAAAGARRPAGGARRRGGRIWSPTPRRCSRQFEALNDYVQDVAARLDRAHGAPPSTGSTARRLPLAGSLRRLRRDVGPPVDLDRPARRHPLGRRAVLDPPPRPGAAVRQAGPRRAAASSSSRPRRTRRSGWRSRATASRGQPQSGRRAAMRVGYFGPEGTFTQEALIGRDARGAELEPVPLPTIYDTVMAVHDGARRAGAGADRELARGLGQRDSRRAGDGDRGRRASSARWSTRSATA